MDPLVNTASYETAVWFAIERSSESSEWEICRIADSPSCTSVRRESPENEVIPRRAMIVTTTRSSIRVKAGGFALGKDFQQKNISDSFARERIFVIVLGEEGIFKYSGSIGSFLFISRKVQENMAYWQDIYKTI